MCAWARQPVATTWCRQCPPHADCDCSRRRATRALTTWLRLDLSARPLAAPTLYWTAQAVDNSFQGGPFAAEASVKPRAAVGGTQQSKARTTVAQRTHGQLDIELHAFREAGGGWRCGRYDGLDRSGHDPATTEGERARPGARAGADNRRASILSRAPTAALNWSASAHATVGLVGGAAGGWLECAAKRTGCARQSTFSGAR